MRIEASTTLLAILVAVVSFPETAAAVSLIWNGPSIEFSKVAFADSQLSENQDRITDNVWITRDDLYGIYNAAVEDIPQQMQWPGPGGTEWAEGTIVDGIESLEFSSWIDAISSSPPTSIGNDYVVHLIDDDIYIDLRFTSWGVGNTGGGSFSYIRSTAPVPEPTAIVLASLTVIIVTLSRRLQRAK